MHVPSAVSATPAHRCPCGVYGVPRDGSAGRSGLREYVFQIQRVAPHSWAASRGLVS